MEPRVFPCALRMIWAGALAVLLAACGGGGGGDDSPITHSVTVTAGANGSITPPRATVSEGETIEFTLAPDEHYEVGSINGCGGTLSADSLSYTTAAVTADCTVSVVFALEEFEITTSLGANGAIDGETTVSYGGTSTFTLTPAEGYGLYDISGCGGTLSGNTYITDTITADCELSVTFARAAAVVIGQPDFGSSTTGTARNLLRDALGNPTVVAGVLYLNDYGNNRVLGFNTVPTANGADADFVIGAEDFTGTGALAGVRSAAGSGGQLFIARPDSLGIYKPVPTANTMDVGLGFDAAGVGGLAEPEVATGGDKLVVTDVGHHRVLIWNTIPATATALPDVVLGQLNGSATAPNQGLAAPTAATLNAPAGAWTDGTRVVVADRLNHRVLIWNTAPATGQVADLVLGQPDFTSSAPNRGLPAPTASTLSGPAGGVFVSGGRLFVADTGNGRVLVWNSWPTVSGQAADEVIGKPDLTTAEAGMTLDATTLTAPTGLWVEGTNLIVGDGAENRYLVFDL